MDFDNPGDPESFPGESSGGNVWTTFVLPFAGLFLAIGGPLLFVALRLEPKSPHVASESHYRSRFSKEEASFVVRDEKLTNECLLRYVGVGLPDVPKGVAHRFSLGSGETSETVDFVIGGDESDRRAYVVAVAEALPECHINSHTDEDASLFLHEVGSYSKWNSGVFETKDRFVFSWFDDRNNDTMDIHLDVKTGAVSFTWHTW